MPPSALSKSVLLCFDDELEIAQRIAQAASMTLEVLQRHRFPDGEIKLCRKRCQSMSLSCVP